MTLVTPRIFQTTWLPAHERLLELREELSDLQNRENMLELELENLPEDIHLSSSETDSDSDSGLETWRSIVYGWVGGPPLLPSR